MEVKLVSRETIKPSSPTPLHLQTFTLSYVDQFFPAFHIPILLCYPKTIGTPINTNLLKTSLATTLTKFYPLAGRCIDNSTILCNDHGIPFIETHVNCPISTLFNSPNKLNLLHKLLPPQDISSLGQNLCDLVPLAFQINIFQCGGFVLGCYMLHKFLDGTSLGTFLKYWAFLANKKCDDQDGSGSGFGPDFESTAKAFVPTSLDLKPILFQPKIESKSIEIRARSFIFSNASLSVLKNKGTSDFVLKPTRFEALAAFIWNKLWSSRSGSSSLMFTVDMRARTNPPLPKGSMGNLFMSMQAHAKDGSGLPGLLKEIHSTILNIKNEVAIYQGENGVEAFYTKTESEVNDMISYKTNLFMVTSWCNLGLKEVDFGFGKPKWIVPFDGRTPPSKNFIIFTDHIDSYDNEGIEAWLFLEEHDMEDLLNDSEFFAFACPN
ncbi:stemmadenine O-acetyltransferase-like [Amaranthus tricolor]|uniref:stemmadenine O-acetyltransferase-like n=1 Tax=Amaranthus tricolor TaxID=29722 RepID=UPI00258BCE54|nr:stemmadenine O-acetyltransferase-like [Amaranthus tricolor]XP_057544303.1 stemmadenine O-acetyltransferase-like [Amaranthus tricolor]